MESGGGGVGGREEGRRRRRARSARSNARAVALHWQLADGRGRAPARRRSSSPPSLLVVGCSPLRSSGCSCWGEVVGRTTDYVVGRGTRENPEYVRSKLRLNRSRRNRRSRSSPSLSLTATTVLRSSVVFRRRLRPPVRRVERGLAFSKEQLQQPAHEKSEGGRGGRVSE